MAMNMKYSKWENMSVQEQNEYLLFRGIEVVGYTLAGPNSFPSDVEFSEVMPSREEKSSCTK